CPVERYGIRRASGYELADLGQLARFLLRVIRWRRRLPKLIAGREHPRFPGASQRLQWIGAAPEPRPLGHGAGPGNLRAIVAGVIHQHAADLAPQVEAGRDVAWELDASLHA